MRSRLNHPKQKSFGSNHPIYPQNYLQVDPNCSVTLVEMVRDLNAILDLIFTEHEGTHYIFYDESCLFHLRHIQQVERFLNKCCLQVLVQALIKSRTDYCNTILARLPSVTLHLLTTILHVSTLIDRKNPSKKE